MTRSTAPMSMPSSSELVATRPLSSPRLSSSSIWRRRSRDREPWWAFTTSRPGSGGRPSASAARFSPSAANSLRRVASRSARRRALTKMRVERCSCTSSSSRGWMEGQMLRRAGDAAGPSAATTSTSSPSAPMSSTGTTTSISSGLRMPASTMVTGRGTRRVAPDSSTTCWYPPRKRAISSSGRWVADRPMRWGGRSHRSSSRSRLSARCEPRLVGRQGVDLVDDDGLDVAQGVAGRRGEHEVEGLGRGDQQVGRGADQLAALVGGGVAGAHAHGGGVELETQAFGGQADAHERSTQVLLDIDGQGPKRRQVDQAGAAGLVVGGRPGDQSIEPPQERGQGLARARWAPG